MSLNGLEIALFSLKVETESGRTKPATLGGSPIRFSAPSIRAGSEAKEDRVPIATACEDATPRVKRPSGRPPKIAVTG